MKKNRKNKGRKSLTAVGAVVAAGLTPGIVTGTPASPVPNQDVEITAADAVSINGDIFDFDELFAMQQGSRDPQVQKQKTVYGPPQPKVYGPPPGKKDKDKDKNKGKDKDKDKDRINDIDKDENAIREAMLQDSINRAMANQALVYGPPTPKYHFVNPEELRSIAAADKEEAVSITLRLITDYCYFQLPTSKTNGILSEDCNLFRDVQIDAIEQENLLKEIERRFGVQMNEDMLKQLGTPRRIANFIVEVITPLTQE